MTNRYSISIMVLVAVAVGLGGTTTGCVTGRQRGGSTSVAVAEITSGTTTVIGKLGHPLGTVVEVEAIIVAAPVTGPTSPLTYQLEVHGINNVPLAKPRVLNFLTDINNPVYVASSQYQLERLLQQLVEVGRHAPDESGALSEEPPISKAKAAAIQQNYLGSKHRLVVYEAGRLDGTPKNLPEEYGYLGQRKPFTFETFLKVLAEK